MQSSSSLTRIRLRVMLKLLLAAGLVFASVPFLSYVLSAGEGRRLAGEAWELEVDVRALAVNEVREIAWPGGAVWVLRRPRGLVAELERIGPVLGDAHSQHSQQPAAARNPWRSIDPEFFVVLAHEPRRGCRLRLAEAQPASSVPPDINIAGGFFEPCGGAWFDPAGRVYRGTGAPGQTNLTVPAYRITAPGRIRLLAPGVDE